MVKEGLPVSIDHIELLKAEGIYVDPEVDRMVQAGMGEMPEPTIEPYIAGKVGELVGPETEAPAAQVPAWQRWGTLSPEGQQGLQEATKKWQIWDDVPPEERGRMIAANARIKMGMQKIGSIETFERIAEDFVILALTNRGYDMGGKKFETPYRYPSLDKFLAETWLKNPWLRAERGGLEFLRAPVGRETELGLKRSAFSAKAHEQVLTESQTTLEHINFYLGFSPRYVQGLVAESLGHKKMDAVLAAYMYGEHGKTGDAIADVVPGIVDNVMGGLWPFEPALEGEALEHLRAGRYREHRPLHQRKRLTGDEKITLRKKAKMLVSIAAEVTIDPMWFAGYGATSRTVAALGQVKKMAKMGEVSRYQKVAKEIGGPAGRILLEEARTINKTIVDGAKKILSTTDSIHEARKKIRVLLGKHAGPNAVDYMDNVIGEAWGKHGLTFRIPFLVEGAPLPAWAWGSAESMARGRRSFRAMSWLARRKAIRTVDKLWNRNWLHTRLNMKDRDIEGWFDSIRKNVTEGFSKLVIPEYRYSMGRYMDWAADGAANRLLDDAFGGAPIEAAARTSKEMANYKKEIQELLKERDTVARALAAPAPGGGGVHLAPTGILESIQHGRTTEAGRVIKERRKQLARIDADIQERQQYIIELTPAQKEAVLLDLPRQRNRHELSKILGDALMMDSPVMRKGELNRFRKRLLQLTDEETVTKFEPTLELLQEGKWPEKMAARGYAIDPRQVISERKGDIEQFNMLLDDYEAVIDAAARTNVTSGKNMADALRGKTKAIGNLRGELTITGETIPLVDQAGDLLMTEGKDFMDLLPKRVLDQFPADDLVRIQRAVTFALDEFALMAEEANRLGIPMNVIDDYYPGIYRKLDNVIPDSGPLASELGSGPGTFNPMMRKSLSSAQATAIGLNPERNIVKMLVARRLAHEQAIAQTRLIHGALGTTPPKHVGMTLPTNQASVTLGEGKKAETVRFSLGREIDDLTEVRRGDEAVLHWQKPEVDKHGKWTGNWVEQDYAVPKYVKEGLNDVMNGLANPSSPIAQAGAQVNTWFRGILTSPNPGYHMRNALSNTVLSWMAGVRNPDRYATSFWLSVTPDSADELLRTDELIKTLKATGKGAEAANLIKRRSLRKKLFDSVVDPTIVNPLTDNPYTYGEVRALAVKHGAMNKGWFSVDMAGTLSREIDFATSPLGERLLAYSGAGGIAKGAAKGAAAGTLVGQPAIGAAVGGLVGGLGPDSLIMKMGRKGGEWIENQARVAVFWNELIKGTSPAEAARHVDRYLYNYKSITKVEKDARQVILFYTWIRKNLPRMAEELYTRPGRIGAQRHLERSMEKVSEKEWDGVQTEYMRRYYSKMMGVRLPHKTKLGVSMLALDLPWRDLNLVDMNLMSSLESLQHMITPIVSVGGNGIMDILDRDLFGFGRGKRRYGNEMVEAPGWMKTMIPGEAIKPGVDNSGSGYKKRLGFELRADPYLSAQEGTQIIKEYIPEHVGWWFNQIPMMAFAGKMSGEDLTKEQKRAYAGISYLFGFRMLEYQPVQAQQMAMYDIAEGVRRERPGHLTTGGVSRNLAEDAAVMSALAAYELRKKNEAKLTARGGGWGMTGPMPPSIQRTWKGEEEVRKESMEALRNRALRRQAEGK